jgi:hypothetical protein
MLSVTSLGSRSYPQPRPATHAAAELPAFAVHKLIDLACLVVQRQHRTWDDEYARLARALPVGRHHDIGKPLKPPITRLRDFIDARRKRRA